MQVAIYLGDFFLVYFDRIVFIFSATFPSDDVLPSQMRLELIVDAFKVGTFAPFLLQGTGGELEGCSVCIAAARNPAGSKGEAL